MSRLDVMVLPEFDITGGRIYITSPYGMRWGRLHAGVDIGSMDGIEIGTTIHAPADGSIVAIKRNNANPSEGLNLWFVAKDGRRWKFFHLNSVLFSVNTEVKAGTVIAHVGMTGTSAAHLHLEEHVGGWSNPVDCTADVREAMLAGRWPGKPVIITDPPVVIGQPISEEEMPGAPICKFPEPAKAFFFAGMNGMNPCWYYIPDAKNLRELQEAGLVSKTDVRFFASGNEDLDRAWAEWDKTHIPPELR